MKSGLKQDNFINLNSDECNNIVKFDDIKNSIILENGENFINAKNKLLKQLPNIYKNTRLQKFTIQSNPISAKLEYKRVKGLVLNVQKRMCWYLNLETIDTRCLLISTKARTANEDLIYDDRNKYFFDYYCKFIFQHNQVTKFICIPLVNLNVTVI